MNIGMKTKFTFLSKKNLLLDPLAPFGSAPFLTRSKKGARSKKGQTKVVSSFHGDTRRNGDGTWKGGMDSSMIPNADRPDDDDFYSNVRDDEFYYASDYSCCRDSYISVLIFHPFYLLPDCLTVIHSLRTPF